MSNIPSNLKYADSHEWVLDNGDGTVTVGITDHAQELLGDVVYLELPEVGAETTASEQFSLVESVKAASDIYAPVSGEVVEVNEALDDSPELVNESPFEDAWIAKIKLSDASELDKLMDADAYASSIE
ncbi:MAG: glycine cleavage system protein H [Marinomonas sp.]|jgi:glycine cleavage system H protein|uniref:glycine cleavage system protein GcvH n=1 Tax=Marinomonas communis TaxID=28254 RepID=UPI000C435609|nr:glycine cleavage system protein GcvH [Marinomonas communis]MAF16590.1 glycine cleavage system protein H [Marinomonas sp.]MEC8082208.1 glycine cleavage system protein GcvH [Pseudomonadota bacterium]MCC4276085.1 glycine cleavage system protein GcvH [Marinomonas communis]MEC8485275.1 glycine cleavage system protein GcvH [Pseudomonadota bacterium]RUM54915.1 MAG: glycine cleavage system protein GcvH [Marinomonas sp.]|tara:strand:+ start:820 stop:1203 length:384 start_codon:yes stop_codon:yes gene_type:complete